MLGVGAHFSFGRPTAFSQQIHSTPGRKAQEPWVQMRVHPGVDAWVLASTAMGAHERSE